MRVEIVAKNYKVRDHIKDIINDKLEKFSRYFDDEALAKIMLKQDGKDKYVMEITIFFGGNIVRSEVMSDNMYNNIDIALPKIEGQIRKHRTKLDRMRKSALEADSLYELPKAKEKELVKTKSFELKKISVEEAIAEMELVDHDFFAFVNEANGMVNIVYRRADGNVGMIDLVY